MALIKEWEDPAGQAGDYWRMTQINIYRAEDAVEITLMLYKNKAARDGGKHPIPTLVHATMPLAAGNDITIDALMSQAYTWLKENKHSDQTYDEEPYFKDAVDD